MASDGYEVLTSALLEASAQYESAGESLARSLARFKSASALDGSVWGRLADAGSTASQYDDLRTHVINHLTSMYKALVSGTANLAASAARYRAADAATAALVRGLQKSGFSEQQIATVEELDAGQ